MNQALVQKSFADLIVLLNIDVCRERRVKFRISVVSFSPKKEKCAVYISQKINISAQTLQMALHNNPTMYMLMEW